MNIRPIYHFTPPQGFMNDPNGLVYLDGEYHLFYQHNPFGITWAHMSWGHAISKDCLLWEHLPVALAEENGIMIFSGSAVVDEYNMAAFRQDGTPNQSAPVTAIYTGHGLGRQTQNLAFSLDRGRTWTKYANNPVLDIGSNNFRDPKVFWHAPSQRWVMVTVLSAQHQVSFYTSSDLRTWVHCDDFGAAELSEAGWECPDLFELPIQAETGQAWVLKVDSGPGWYIVGTFDGNTFTAIQPPERMDYGLDFYACQTWSHLPPGQHRLIGWMANWRYARVMPTIPWRGMMTIPRSISLRRTSAGLRLAQQPIDTSVLRRQVFRSHGLLNGEEVLPVNGIALEIIADFDVSTASEFGLRLRVGEGESTVVGYIPAAEQVFVDRREAGEASFDAGFPDIFTAPVAIKNGHVSLHILVDSCSVEVFSSDGTAVISCLIFPSETSRGVSVFASGGYVNLKNLQVWNLEN